MRSSAISLSGENAEPSTRRATTTSSNWPHSQQPTVMVLASRSAPGPPRTVARRSQVVHSYRVVCAWPDMAGCNLMNAAGSEVLSGAMRVRSIAMAAVIIVPLLLAGCSRTYSNGQEFRNASTFAALKSDGSVVAWGSPTRGGDPACTINPANCAPAPAGSLASGVSQIFSNSGAYAALKDSGALVTWGGTEYGGDPTCALAVSCHAAPASSLVSGVVTVSSTNSAFAARKADGSVITWGHPGAAGDAGCAPAAGCSPAPAGSLSSGVTRVWGSYDAFAALHTDGSVVAWGDPSSGGDASAPVGGSLTGVVNVVPGGFAFAALRQDGSVVTWGAPASGGDPTCPGANCTAAPAGSLASGVVDLNSTNAAFAARKADGSVVTWGSTSDGGDSSTPVGGTLAGVTALAANDAAFAAVKADGSVVAWGDAGYGGDPACAAGPSCSPAPTGALASGVVQVVGTRQAFVARKADGSVVAWGNPAYGGDPSCVLAAFGCTPAPVGALSGGVVQVMWTADAFIARKQDGSVVTWGASTDAGDSSQPVGGVLAGATQAFSNSGAAAVITATGGVVAWGADVNGGNPSCTAVPSGTCSPAPAGSLSSGVVYIASPFAEPPAPAPVTPAANPAASPAAPTGGDAATTVPGRLPGRTTCTPRGCTTRGQAPAGTTSVTQAAAAITTPSGRARANAAATLRTRGHCTLSGGAYACRLRLGPGRWAITTRALAGTTVLAQSATRVRIARAGARGRVTG